MTVRLAEPADRASVVDTVVAAFQNDPAFLLFFGDGPEYPELAATFAGYLFDTRVSSRTVWVADEGAAVAMWNGPDRETSPGSSLDLPGDVLERIEVFVRTVDAALPSAPHWYLSILASHPSRRGEGLGRLVARAGISAARADDLPAILETTNESNVSLYQRAGWSVREELVDVAGLHVWIMDRRLA